MAPLVAIIMGSKSDWETMSHAAQTLDALAIPYEARVMSAHRTPDLVDDYVGGAEGRGLEVIIAGASARPRPGPCSPRAIRVNKQAGTGIDFPDRRARRRPDGQ